ncbi:MAG: XdhC protein [Hyphomicrobiales bacterium]|nr:XdhC protein [Hyphomicrobiales bacterium]
MLMTRLASLLAKGERVVHVMVERAQGSTPREAGAAMLVLESGDFHGTIGGGALEWEALHLARSMFASGQPTVIRRDFPLGPELAQCCGGRMALRFEMFAPEDVSRIAQRAASDESGELTPLALFGAGHVGRALVLALAPLPFRVRWIDSRAEAFPALAPANVEMHAPADPVAEIDALDAGAFILVMTHSHPLDLAIVSQALAHDFPFVGLIGSDTKRARFESRMRDAGMSDAARERLVCPVGVEGIDGKEPAIIAASMAAALLRARELTRTTP